MALPGFGDDHLDQVAGTIYIAGTADLSTTGDDLPEEDRKPLGAYCAAIATMCEPEVIDEALEQARHRMAHGPEYNPASGWTVERAVVVLTEAQRLSVKMT